MLQRLLEFSAFRNILQIAVCSETFGDKHVVYIYLSSVFMSADRNLCTCIDRVIEFEWKIKGLLGRAVMQWQHHISLCLSSYVEACWGVLFPLAAIGSWSLIFFFLCSWLTILVWCHVNPLAKLFWLKGKRPPIGSTLFTLWCISRCLKFGVSKISLRKLMLLLTNWSKATVKTYIVSTNISSKLCSFKLSNRQSQQFRMISEGCCDTGVMPAEISALASQE